MDSFHGTLIVVRLMSPGLFMTTSTYAAKTRGEKFEICFPGISIQRKGILSRIPITPESERLQVRSRISLRTLLTVAAGRSAPLSR
jgi:hypothetical protein